MSENNTNPLSSLYNSNFDAMTISLASPEKILEWSWGEVTKPETINYRTQRSEKNGLFDEKIFGPERDYECYCAKYRGIRYRGIVCEKCGVEITRSIVRRERMGHIELASPVSHVWFLRGVPSRMALLLGVKSSDLEKVIYFAGYIVTFVDEDERKRIMQELDEEYKAKVPTLKDEEQKDKLKNLFLLTKQEIDSIQRGAIIDDTVYNKFVMKYGSMFDAEVGAEAIYNIFKNINLEKLQEKLQKEYDASKSVGTRSRIRRRLSIAQGMSRAKVRPEWMFLSRIPVLPPALRPMVALDGGRHATSDVNDLYRRVINRNNRLKKLMGINAPHVILRNEKRILQEAVDALIDNSIRRSTASSSAAARRPLKSLADNLKGKSGLFRQNLLGKRVDYSARSVIVVGPTLALDECGIPKTMALELFRPFIISELIKSELAFNIRGANKLIDEGVPEVWAILEEVIEGKYVLLNRAPTLHRLGMQAFRPILVEGKAIQVHPLVCPAFNADFDGDTMSVHVPLSIEAQTEAREIMTAAGNILKPGSGQAIVSEKLLDIVLGSYWMTKSVDGLVGEGMSFPSPNYAITAFDYGAVDLRAKISVLPTTTEKYSQFEGKPFQTSVGRLLFNSVLPTDFPYVNEEIVSKVMQRIYGELIEKYGIRSVAPILDRIKTFGFKYSTYAGITWGLDDVVEPVQKASIIKGAETKVAELRSYFDQGLLTAAERYQKSIQIWTEAKSEVESHILESLDKNGSVHDMVVSGARGSLKSLSQMAGFKGLINNNRGEILEMPIKTGAFEGYSPLEYFTSTHGSRKGLTDTALNTATAGYLTRKLFDVAQDVVITSEQSDEDGFVVIKEENLGGLVLSVSRQVQGRYLAADIVSPSGKVIAKKEDYISYDIAQAIDKEGVEAVSIYSPLATISTKGLSQRVYGKDMSTDEPIDLGEAVGTVAAQAIGEPGTQLTMRTFHSGGTAALGGDITQGLPRVIEIFERRIPRNPAVISHLDGTISEIEEKGVEKVIRILPDTGTVVKGKKGDLLEYRVRQHRTPLVKVGDKVSRGQFLTDGSADLQELYKYAGKGTTQAYIIQEILKIYELQGASVSRKHIEVIVSQMFSRLRITKSGDTSLSIGDISDRSTFAEENAFAQARGGEEAAAEEIILGISDVALTRHSFLSSASFQHTTRVLIEASLEGKMDTLRGLKENVIIGRLIPAGTGFKGSKKYSRIAEIHAARDVEKSLMSRDDNFSA